MFYLHRVQALQKSQETVEHILALMAADIMYKTGSRLSDFCRQLLPEETREAQFNASAGLHITQVIGCLWVALRRSWKDHRGRWVMEFLAGKGLSFHIWDGWRMSPGEKIRSKTLLNIIILTERPLKSFRKGPCNSLIISSTRSNS